MPTKSECKKVKVGQSKVACGRKSKCGLNLQAICDSNKRFLDISILYGASASDLLAFESSPIRVKMETLDFLAPGLCVFGDNAYINRDFMATLYLSVNYTKRRMSTTFSIHRFELK